jgi:rhamnose utilization protein RhaD (predicted bifunctional aldolase and dehydrogenase)
MISGKSYKVGHFDDSDAVLDSSIRRICGHWRRSALLPDHFLRTKIRPLVIDFDPDKPDIDAVLAGLPKALEDYRAGYQAYYDRCKHANSPAVRDPNAVVYLMPGVGMFTFAADKATARISGEFYVNAINVMRGASAVSTYVGLPEQEAFDIEYWLLEEAKLQRMPKPKSLAGRIAFVTGGPAASARRRRCGCCRKAPASCWPTSTRKRWPTRSRNSVRCSAGTSCVRRS